MADLHHTLVDRVVVTESGCMEWTRSTNNKGYGYLRICNKAKLAHRISYERSVGPIPDDTCVLHRCDNPICINPNHLFLGTRKDNWDDCVRKGRNRSRDSHGENNTRCKLTEAQVLMIRDDKRIARIVAAELNVEMSTVQKIRSRTTWKHIP